MRSFTDPWIKALATSGNHYKDGAIRYHRVHALDARVTVGLYRNCSATFVADLLGTCVRTLRKAGRRAKGV